ncbi:MAG: hypothetical protein RIT45_2215 [Pseudomonadota bacterium]
MSERRSNEASEQEVAAGVVVGEADDFAADTEEKTDPELGVATAELLAAFEAQAAERDASDEPDLPAEAVAAEPDVPELPVEAVAVEPEPPAVSTSEAPPVPDVGASETQPFFFSPPAPQAAPGPIADLGTLSFPSPSSRRRSRQDMSSMLQEFSVMFRVDDRSRKRKAALWTTLLVLLLAGVGGAILYVASRAPDTAELDLGEPLQNALPAHAESTEYLLLDRSQTPPRSERKRVSALAGKLAQLAAVRALRAQGEAGKVQ